MSKHDNPELMWHPHKPSAGSLYAEVHAKRGWPSKIWNGARDGLALLFLLGFTVVATKELRIILRQSI